MDLSEIPQELVTIIKEFTGTFGLNKKTMNEPRTKIDTNKMKKIFYNKFIPHILDYTLVKSIHIYRYDSNILIKKKDDLEKKKSIFANLSEKQILQFFAQIYKYEQSFEFSQYSYLRMKKRPYVLYTLNSHLDYSMVELDEILENTVIFGLSVDISDYDRKSKNFVNFMSNAFGCLSSPIELFARNNDALNKMISLRENKTLHNYYF